MKLRESVELFSKDMENRLRENDHKGGWLETDRKWLLKMAESNLASYKNQPLPIHLVDAANYIMMAHDIQSRIWSQMGDPGR